MAAAVLAVAATLLVATLDAMDRVRTSPDSSFDIGAALGRVLRPEAVGGWVQITGILAFALVGGMFIAAARKRRSTS
jgi:hypothetical protein